MQRIFAQIFPNLPKKLLFNICRPFFDVASKKWSTRVFLKTLGAIFAQIFRDFVEIFSDFVWMFRDFAQIFRDFARIFNKSKLLVVLLHPLHPCPLHHCFQDRWFTRFHPIV